MPSRASTHRTAALQHGLSTVESLVGAAIVTTLIAASAGGLVSWRAQLALQQAAAGFETDVHHARSLAVARNESVRLSFDDTSDGRCWIVHTGPRGACRCLGDGLSECVGAAEVLRLAHWGSGQPVRFDANARSIAFDPLHGTASPAATVRFSASSARPIHQVVSIMGRVRSCVPGGPVPGYRAC